MTVPFLLFWACYAATVAWLHHYWPVITWSIVIAAILICVAAYLAERKVARLGHVYDAVWGYFLFAALLIGVVAGTLIGNSDYQTYWHYVYDFKALESYVNIDPSQDVGGAYMDGGQYYFKEGTHIDTSRVVAFKNFDVYCVGPLIRKQLEDDEKPDAKLSPDPPIDIPPSGTIDWFAVGVNCCEPNGEKWTCSPTTAGSNLSPARSGLRVLDPDHRPFYNMAAQSWSIKYKIPVKTPIFSELMIDPLSKITGKKVAGGLRYWNIVYLAFGVNVVVVLLLVIFLETQA